MDRDPEALFREGRAALPAWNEDDPGELRFGRALTLLREAAEAGHLGAMELLAEGTDPERAVEWATRLAHVGLCKPLASVLTDTDHPPAVGLEVLAAADAGEAWAMLAVGMVYGMGMVDGRGVPIATRDGGFGWMRGVRDPKAEARAWWERAATLGFGPALLWLGLQDRRAAPADALRRVREALAAPVPLAAPDRALARRLLPELLDAAGAGPDEQLALRRGLAADGDADALCGLAARHQKGEGVPKDPTEARRLFEAAAAAGSVEGWRELGKMREKGQGGPRDDDGARAAYEQAAELGADRYARGRLVEKWGLGWYGTG